MKDFVHFQCPERRF